MHKLFETSLLVVVLTVATAGATTRVAVLFDQRAPDTRTFVTATLVAECPGGPAEVRLDGTTIHIDVPHGGCPGVIMPIPMKAKIGFLTAGNWAVVVNGLSPTPGAYTTHLFVRGVDPLRVIPAGGPTKGGNPVSIMNGLDFPFDLSHPSTVYFGDQAITDFHVTADGTYLITAPPHAAGDVPVMIAYQTAPNQQTQLINGPSYRYTDAVDDPYATEPLLFPIAYEGAGAYGSQWTTQNSFHVIGWAAPGFAAFMWPPCNGCPTAVVPQGRNGVVQRLDKTSSPAGVVLRVLRDTAAGIVGSSRMRDLSRQAQSAGVEIPVVREADFRPLVTLENPSRGGNFRNMLRIWALDEVSSPVQACLEGKGHECIDLQFSQATPTTLPFASADVTSLLSALAPGDEIWINVGDQPGFPIGIGRFWAMLSTTNNDTQQVTIVTAH